jgi:Family of unknown function (DUF6188)
MAIMTSIHLTETDGRWPLPLGNCAVTQCCVDYGVTLRFDHPAGPFELRIEQSLDFVAADGTTYAVDPEDDPTGVGPLLACTRSTVTRATAFRDGRFAIEFADDSRLSVSASDDYEAWELAGPSGLRMVSTPGGDLTVWQGDA